MSTWGRGFGTARIIQGDALHLPLPDSSVDLICTSPPYFGLRSYRDGGEHYAGQIGSEATPAEFVDALIAATAEMVRVLKPSGSIFVNLGDKYAERTGPARRGGVDDDSTVKRPADRPARGRRGNVPPKSLIGVPWRYAIRCIDDLGLILRAEIIWSKPNGLPESVTDRVRRSHETWFHLTKEPRYYSAVDEIREPQLMTGGGDRPKGQWQDSTAGLNHRDAHTAKADYNPLGKLPGSVWSIPTQPLTVPAHLGVDHFAAFPMEWPRRIIRGWCPAGVCVACGQGRRPVSVTERTSRDALRPEYGAGNHGTGGSTLGPRGVISTITGYTCACPDTTAPTTPGRVLDPFGGTGTTSLVAKVLGRDGISVDYSGDYCRLARWRTTNPDQIASAMEVPKPAPQVDGQGDLFDEVTA